MMSKSANTNIDSSDDESITVIEVNRSPTLEEPKEDDNVTVISPPINNKRKHLGSTFNRGHDKKNCIDLSGDDNGNYMPYFYIKNSYPLFYSYDPRGDKRLAESYLLCDDCTCPIIYCADRVIGQVAATRTLAQIKEEDIQDYEDDDILSE